MIKIYKKILSMTLALMLIIPHAFQLHAGAMYSGCSDSCFAPGEKLISEIFDDCEVGLSTSDDSDSKIIYRELKRLFDENELKFKNPISVEMFTELVSIVILGLERTKSISEESKEKWFDKEVLMKLCTKYLGQCKKYGVTPPSPDFFNDWSLREAFNSCFITKREYLYKLFDEAQPIHDLVLVHDPALDKASVETLNKDSETILSALECGFEYSGYDIDNRFSDKVFWKIVEKVVELLAEENKISKESKENWNSKEMHEIIIDEYHRFLAGCGVTENREAPVTGTRDEVWEHDRASTIFGITNDCLRNNDFTVIPDYSVIIPKGFREGLKANGMDENLWERLLCTFGVQPIRSYGGKTYYIPCLLVKDSSTKRFVSVFSLDYCRPIFTPKESIYMMNTFRCLSQFHRDRGNSISNWEKYEPIGRPMIRTDQILDPEYSHLHEYSLNAMPSHIRALKNKCACDDPGLIKLNAEGKLFKKP